MTGNSLDPYVSQYASRTSGMRASAIRALFAVASRPEVVSLAGGMPFLQSLPLAELAESADKLIATDGTIALQYGSGQGIPALREQICDVMALEGIVAEPDDVVVTVGSQMALDLVSKIFCDPVTSSSPRHRRMSVRSPCSRPTRPKWCTSRWTRTG